MFTGMGFLHSSHVLHFLRNVLFCCIKLMRKCSIQQRKKHLKSLTSLIIQVSGYLLMRYYWCLCQKKKEGPFQGFQYSSHSKLIKNQRFFLGSTLCILNISPISTVSRKGQLCLGNAFHNLAISIFSNW